MTEKILEKESKPVLPVWARIVLVIISYSILVGIFQVIGMLIAKIPLTGLSALKDISIKQQLILQLFGFLPLILIVYTFRKFIDKKSIKSIGFSLKNRFAEIVAGFIIALFIIGGGSLILYAFNHVEFLNIRIDIYSLLLGFLLFLSSTNKCKRV
jgi:hypothetical protein